MVAPNINQSGNSSYFPPQKQLSPVPHAGVCLLPTPLPPPISLSHCGVLSISPVYGGLVWINWEDRQGALRQGVPGEREGGAGGVNSLLVDPFSWKTFSTALLYVHFKAYHPYSMWSISSLLSLGKFSTKYPSWSTSFNQTLNHSFAGLILLPITIIMWPIREDNWGFLFLLLIREFLYTYC